jgi:hypothetical protein
MIDCEFAADFPVRFWGMGKGGDVLGSKGAG